MLSNSRNIPFLMEIASKYGLEILPLPRADYLATRALEPFPE